MSTLNIKFNSPGSPVPTPTSLFMRPPTSVQRPRVQQAAQDLIEMPSNDGPDGPDGPDEPNADTAPQPPQTLLQRFKAGCTRLWSDMYQTAREYLPFAVVAGPTTWLAAKLAPVAASPVGAVVLKVAVAGAKLGRFLLSAGVGGAQLSLLSGATPFLAVAATFGLLGLCLWKGLDAAAAKVQEWKQEVKKAWSSEALRPARELVEGIVTLARKLTRLTFNVLAGAAKAAAWAIDFIEALPGRIWSAAKSAISWLRALRGKIGRIIKAVAAAVLTVIRALTWPIWAPVAYLRRPREAERSMA